LLLLFFIFFFSSFFLRICLFSYSTDTLNIIPIVLCGCKKLGLSPYGKEIDWECLGTRCWGEYLDLSERKCQEVGEYCVIKSSIICTLHQVYGW
jgi:hypothetical protein